ncbi:SGNH/GDSL hydrolase family protein [Flindersiella endophytica]
MTATTPSRVTGTLRRRVLLTAVVAAATALVPVTATPALSSDRSAWTGTWETAPVVGLTDHPDVAPGYTIRNVVHVSVGGLAVRVRFSNAFGTGAQVLDHVTVALQAGGTDSAAAVPGTIRTVRFDGRARVTLPAGADRVSDPVRIDVRADSNLLVTTYLRTVSGPVTAHLVTKQVNFVASDGADHAADAGAAAFGGQSWHWNYLTGVDVVASRAAGSIVAFGDSITDGNATQDNANHRWPDLLYDRIRTESPARRQYGVLNAGISGNRLLLDGGNFGINALARIDEDVFSRPGVRTMIVLLGINDIQQEPHQTDPGKITAAYEEIARRAHARGIRVIGATMTPFKGWRVWDETLEATRVAVNDYIRTSRTFDGVADFDAATRDPADPQRLLAAYDVGDGLHPNDAGCQAMAGAVPLSKL